MNALAEAAPTAPSVIAARTAGLGLADGTPQKRDEFTPLTLGELRNLPPPAWLVEGIIPKHTATMLYGLPDQGKTFVALDLSLAVATGGGWHGHETKSREGAVVYVAAEGLEGLWQRVDAWLQERGLTEEEVTSFHVVRVPVQLHKPTEVERLIKAVESTVAGPISLIGIDTFAQCFVGGDENSARDTGLFNAGVRRLETHFRAAVMLVHHTTKDGGTYRGSSSLHGALATMVYMEASNGVITLTCEKQRNAPKFKPIRLRLVEAGGSCVLRSEVEGPKLTEGNMECLQALPAQGAAWHEWEEASLQAGVPAGSFDRHRRRLLALGCVEEREERYMLTPSGGAARGLADAGRLSMAA